MSSLAFFTLILVVGLVALSIVEKAPELVRAIADLRVSRDRSLDGLITTHDADTLAAICAQAAIRRLEPGLSDELVEGIAIDVLNDVTAALQNASIENEGDR